MQTDAIVMKFTLNLVSSMKTSNSPCLFMPGLIVVLNRLFRLTTLQFSLN